MGRARDGDRRGETDAVTARLEDGRCQVARQEAACRQAECHDAARGQHARQEEREEDEERLGPCRNPGTSSCTRQPRRRSRRATMSSRGRRRWPAARSSPITDTSVSRRRATGCPPISCSRPSRLPTQRAPSKPGCRRWCCAGGRCRGNGRSPLATPRIRGSRWSSSPKAKGSSPAESDVKDCVTPGTTLGGPNDVARGVYLAVSQTVVDKVFPTAEDLPLLAHVREVDLNDTELGDGR